MKTSPDAFIADALAVGILAWLLAGLIYTLIARWRDKRSRAMFDEQQQAEQRCPHCGSDCDAWFSRTEPMGYFCEECGRSRDEAPASNSETNETTEIKQTKVAMSETTKFKTTHQIAHELLALPDVPAACSVPTPGDPHTYTCFPARIYEIVMDNLKVIEIGPDFSVIADAIDESATTESAAVPSEPEKSEESATPACSCGHNHD